MHKILVVTYGGGHARMLRPVLDRLSLMGCDLHIVALNTARSEYEGVFPNLYGYKDFFMDCTEVVKYGEELIKSLEKIVDHEESLYYLGANFKELVQKYGYTRAHEIYDSGGRYIFEPELCMEKIVASISPDLLLTTNSPRSERFAVVAARKLGIPALAMVDMFGIRCIEWFKDDSFADKVAVLSESVKKHMVEKGRSEKSIVVTGNPSFDSLTGYFEANRREIEHERMTLPFTVLWASQPEPAFLPECATSGDVNLPIKIEKALFKIFKKHPQWRLIARNHPSELRRNYPDFIHYSEQGDDLKKLFSKIHVLLTPSSTLGFQASLLGATLVTVDISVLSPTMPYANMGYSIGLKSIEDIEPTLLKLSQSITNKTPKYTEKNAADRVAKEVLLLLENQLIDKR